MKKIMIIEILLSIFMSALLNAENLYCQPLTMKNWTTGKTENLPTEGERAREIGYELNISDTLITMRFRSGWVETFDYEKTKDGIRKYFSKRNYYLYTNKVPNVPETFYFLEMNDNGNYYTQASICSK